MTFTADPTERVAWVSRLIGNPIDLDDLVHWTSGNQFHVFKTPVDGQPDEYRLYLPIAQVGLGYEGARQRAEAVMIALNGLGAMNGQNFEPVAFDTSMNIVDANGQRRDAVIAVNGLKLRTAFGRATFSVDGQPIIDSTKGMAAALLAQADGSDAVRDALLLIGRDKPTWSELYVAYELVETNDADAMYDRGWVSKSALTLFKRTANSRTALGVHARHGDESWEAPSTPLAYDDAVELIRKLVKAWVSFRTAQSK